MITVLKPGLLTTVQDEGRPGHRAFGMPVAGAVDGLAYAVANALAANPPGAAVLEMTLAGGTFRFDREAYVAVSGADMRPVLEGRAVETWSAFAVPAGATLSFSSAVSGCRCYLAVHGGLDVPAVLGSRSTYVRARVGGLAGRALAAGDVLAVAPVASTAPGPRSLPTRHAPRYAEEIALRVLMGPQDDLFTAGGVAAFLGSAYKVTSRSDRMGCRLEGPAIRHVHGADIVSDAVWPGAIQVPGDGMPIVLLADCQTTGGYAKIGSVIGADLPRLAQARPGQGVRFARCGEGEAVEALREQRSTLRDIAALFA